MSALRLFSFAVKSAFPQHLAQSRQNVARAMRLAAEEMGGIAKQRLRDDVRRAGLGERMANTWRVQVYPDRAQKEKTLQPSVYIYSNASLLVNAFSLGAVIRHKQGLWLAIPLAGVGHGSARSRVRAGRAFRMTPSYAESRYDQDLIFLPTKNPNVKLAGVDTKKKGRLATWRRKGAPEGQRPETDMRHFMPLFIMIRQVRLRPRLSTYRIFKDLEKRWLHVASGTLARQLRP